MKLISIKTGKVTVGACAPACSIELKLRGEDSDSDVFVLAVDLPEDTAYFISRNSWLSNINTDQHNGMPTGPDILEHYDGLNEAYGSAYMVLFIQIDVLLDYVMGCLYYKPSRAQKMLASAIEFSLESSEEEETIIGTFQCRPNPNEPPVARTVTVRRGPSVSNAKEEEEHPVTLCTLAGDDGVILESFTKLPLAKDSMWWGLYQMAAKLILHWEGLLLA